MPSQPSSPEQTTLFGVPEDFVPPQQPSAPLPTNATPRLRLPQRDQVEIRTLALDQLLPDEHPARLVWAYVQGLDFTPLLQTIRAVQGQAGRDANDPRLLLALWLYATIDGVGSARRLDTLCGESLPYQWLCGGVSVNYHSLADFRVAHEAFLDGLLVQSVAALLQQGLINLTRVAQDGLRVRASAGKASFRRAATLKECLREAETQVQALKQQEGEDAASASWRQQQARQRAARERLERVQQALAEVEKLQTRAAEVAQRHGVKKKTERRASTTDPAARTMKMADGGYRPAYNVQLATTAAGSIIVEVAVTNQGSDSGQMSPMLEQMQQHYQQTPQEWLADGGFTALEDITTATREYGATVYVPLKDEAKKKEQGIDPYEARRRDTPEVAAWRARMGTEEAKAIYKERGQVAEWPNAGFRQRGLYQVTVRGQQKVRCVGLCQALVHNLLRGEALRAQAQGKAG